MSAIGRRVWLLVAGALCAAQAAIAFFWRSGPRAATAGALAAFAVSLAATLRASRRAELARPTLGRVIRAFLFALVFLFIGICFQPFRGEIVAAWAAGALALFTVLTVGSDGRPAGRAEIIGLNLALSLIGVELTLRLAAHLKPIPLFAQFGSDAGQYVESIRPKPFTPRPGGMPYNSWGEYDVEPAPKRPGECLAVTIGDSFSAGVVPHPYHFTTVAENDLPGCAIYNMGIAKTGPREYKYLLQKEALGLKPDVIVIDLFLGNDIVDDYGCNPSPLRTLFDRENLLTYVVPRRLAAWSREKRRVGDRSVGVPQLDAAAGAALPWIDDPAKEQPSFSAEAYQEIEQRHARELCTADAERYYPDFFRALDELVAAAGKTPLAFMLIPDELQVDDALYADATRPLAGAPLERDRPQRVVAAWLAARALPYLDLLPILRAAPPWTDGKPHLYHARDTHFNARGNAVTGHALAQFLKPLLKRN